MSKEVKKTSAVKKIGKFFSHGIWENFDEEVSRKKKVLISLARVLTTSFGGILKNRIPVQAASLSYTTLLAIGPMIALVILIAGAFFKNKGDAFLTEKILEVASFVMPAMTELSQLNQDASKPEVNPEILALVNNITKGSGSLGVYGTITMVITCLLLCVNMENVFNSIWGVEKGRTWRDRIFFYWAMLSLGVVGGLLGMTFLAGSQIASALEGIPIVKDYAGYSTYLVGFCAMSVVLACYYKFMPHTFVSWKAALIGAMIITLLLIGNNKLSFFYISYIVKQQNFYGYFAIVPIALFSLYVFWLIILLGSQITFAIQNIEYLSRKQVWDKMSFFSREMMSLTIFAKVSEAFYDGTKAPTLKSLTKDIRLPMNIIKLCLLQMESKNLIAAVEPNLDGDEASFKPSISPDSITLAQFFRTLRCTEEDDIVSGQVLKKGGLAAQAIISFQQYSKTELASKNIRELIGR